MFVLAAAIAPAALLVAAEPATAALLGTVVALAALPVLSRAPGGDTTPLTWRVGVALGAALGCGAALHTPFADLLAPMQAQVHGQGPLLLARGALLLGAFLAAPRAPSRRRQRLLAAVVVAFLASLASQLLLPLLALAAAAALMAGRPAVPGTAGPIRRRQDAQRAGVLAGAGALAAALLALRPAPLPPPHTEQEAALAFLAKDNPWRALPHARAWAAQEHAPGAGEVALARVALRLGDLAEARSMLEDVSIRGVDAGVQAEALQILTSIVVEAKAPL